MTKLSTKNVEIRKRNIEAILNTLFKEKLSASQLSRRLKLSKTAIINILAEMEELELVVNIADNNGTSTKWQRTLYEISKNAGIITILEFGSVYIKIILAYLNGEIIDQTTLDEEEFLTMDSLNNIVKETNKLLNKNHLNNQVLLTIISAPGQISKTSGDIIKSIKFREIKDLNIRLWFLEQLKTPVILKNDINLAILGELDKTKEIETIENAILIFIDSGMGGAIFNEGKILEGSEGFAAEFGLVKTFDKFGNHVYYDLICSINSIKKQIEYQKRLYEEPLKYGRLRYRHVVKLYNEDDPITLDITKYSANKIGELINDLNNIFNYKHFFIGGRIKALGDRYLNWVKEITNGDLINVSYSTYDDDAIIYGAITHGVRYAFKNITELKGNNK